MNSIRVHNQPLSRGDLCAGAYTGQNIFCSAHALGEDTQQ